MIYSVDKHKTVVSAKTKSILHIQAYMRLMEIFFISDKKIYSNMHLKILATVFFNQLVLLAIELN